MCDVHTHLYACLYVCSVRTHVHACLYVVCVPMCIHVCIWCVFIHVYACLYYVVCVLTCMHVCIWCAYHVYECLVCMLWKSHLHLLRLECKQTGIATQHYVISGEFSGFLAARQRLYLEKVIFEAERKSRSLEMA